MPVSSTKNFNFLAVMRRVIAFKYFGEDPTSLGNNTACLNAGAYPGEYVTGMNAAGNGVMNMIGVDGSNNVVFPASTPDSNTTPGVNLFTGGASFTGPLTVAQLNGQYQGPGMPKTVTYNVANNASIGTTAFFIADQAYTITGINYSHKTQGTGTAVCNVTHETGVAAAGAGTGPARA